MSIAAGIGSIDGPTHLLLVQENIRLKAEIETLKAALDRATNVDGKGEISEDERDRLQAEIDAARVDKQGVTNSAMWSEV